MKKKITWENTTVISLFTGIFTVVILVAFSAYFNGSWPKWGTNFLIGDVIVGLTSLVIFGLGLFVIMYKKMKFWAIALVILLLTIPASFGILMMRNGVFENGTLSINQPIQAGPPTFTGQDVFDRVNKYRVDNGVKELKLDDRLCNNISQRYFDVKQGVDENIAHKGFDDWVKKYVPSNFAVAEDVASGQTVDDLIKSWDGSPSHRLSLLNKKYVYGCAYGFEGWGIMILGYTVANQTQAQAVQYNTVSARTGNIVPYHEWCTNKDISVYENELVTRPSTDGKIYSMTTGDWDCYENSLKNKK